MEISYDKRNGTIVGNSRFVCDQDLFFIAGPCVIESEDIVIETAKEVKRVSALTGVQAIFKSSFDKANRTSVDSYRGPGIEKGLEILSRVKQETGLPIISDIHGPEQVEKAAEVLDILQIPAFLSRQTDLLVAAGKSQKAINLKKGQFLSPEDMRHAINKILSTQNSNIFVTERGTSFGYQDLIVDMRSIVRLKQYGFPVIFDATHSAQMPGKGDGCSGGEREMAFPLARAAIAAGADAVFAETHPDPDNAMCDGPNSIHLSDLERFITQIKEMHGMVHGRSMEQPWNSEVKVQRNPIVSQEDQSRLKDIKLIVFDVDGALTDGRINIGSDGVEYKSFHVRDGHGIKLAKRAGFEVALITGRSSHIVEKRAAELEIELVFQGIKDKKPVFDKLLEELNLNAKQVAMLGDDIVDIPILKMVGFAATVPEAPVEVHSVVDYVTKARGGDAAGREFIEVILKAQDKWKTIMDRYTG